MTSLVSLSAADLRLKEQKLFDSLRAMDRVIVAFSGGTDSAYLHKRGVIKYGFTPMILDTDTAATMHSDQERIPVTEFLKGIHIFYDLLSSPF